MTDTPQPRSLGVKAGALLLAFSASVLLWNLAGARVFSAHEGFVVVAAREMAATGDWLIPRIGGEPWLEKPPLPHWCVAVSSLLFHRLDEFTARLPSVLFALAGIFLLASLVARFRGRTAGLLTGLALTPTIYVVTYARLAEADIYLWAMIAACMTVFAWDRVEDAGPERWTRGRLLFFLLLGMTNLAKGPLFGTVLVFVPCLAYLFLQPQRGCWRWLLSPLGLVLFAACAVAWPVAATSMDSGALGLWRTHIVERFTKSECINPQPFWYYFTTLPWQIMPWTLIALSALPASFQRARHEPRSLDRFFFLWLVCMFAVLSLARGKHHHYLIHALPPFAYWTVEGLQLWSQWLGRLWRQTGWRWAVLGISLAGLAVLVAAAPERNLLPRAETAGFGLALVAGSAAISWGCAHGRTRLAVGVLLGLLWAGCFWVNGILMARADNYLPETALLERLADELAPEDRVVLYRMNSTRIRYYLDRPVLECNHLEVVSKLRKTSDVVIFSEGPRDQEFRRFGAERIGEVEKLPEYVRGWKSKLTVYRVKAEKAAALLPRVPKTPPGAIIRITHKGFKKN